MGMGQIQIWREKRNKMCACQIAREREKNVESETSVSSCQDGSCLIPIWIIPIPGEFEVQWKSLFELSGEAPVFSPFVQRQTKLELDKPEAEIAFLF